MDKKKILMIGLLIAFIAVIVVVAVLVSNKSNEVAEQKEIAAQEVDTSNMLEITDNYFIEQTNDIFINRNDYVGKTIKMEGLIYSYKDYSSGEKLYGVVRNTPGCCGNDGLAGLDIRYDGEYPEDKTWVQVVGVLKTDVVAGEEIPAIEVTSLEKTAEGTKFVTN